MGSLTHAKIPASGAQLHTLAFQQQPIWAGKVQFLPLSSRSLLNLNASWHNVLGQPVDPSFFMTNVTNKAYVLSVSQSWNSLGFESVVPNEPRMLGLRLKYRLANKQSGPDATDAREYLV